jgi:hypothetical protein
MCPKSVPDALQNLSLVEEQLIARSRCFGTIVKITKANPTARNANYFHLTGNVIVVPLKPERLFHLLPSPILTLTENLKVIWVGKAKPNPEQLKSALRVSKTKVMSALKQLHATHVAYKDVQIDEAELASWPDGVFVPSGLIDNMTLVDGDIEADERSGYAPDVGNEGVANHYANYNSTAEEQPDDDNVSPQLYSSMIAPVNGDPETFGPAIIEGIAEAAFEPGPGNVETLQGDKLPQPNSSVRFANDLFVKRMS